MDVVSLTTEDPPYGCTASAAGDAERSQGVQSTNAGSDSRPPGGESSEDARVLQIAQASHLIIR